jgi:ATP adenylyltransferase
MESLNAPWRMAYLRRPNPAPADPATFTRIAQSKEDEANYVVVRERTCYAVLNSYPYAGGHLLVVPYTETPDLNGMTDEELCDLMRLTRRCQNALTRVMKPDGFNVGINFGSAAGAGIASHVHIHIVPRWKGDINFMPVVANTAVISEALAETAQALRAALESA